MTSCCKRPIIIAVINKGIEISLGKFHSDQPLVPKDDSVFQDVSRSNMMRTFLFPSDHVIMYIGLRLMNQAGKLIKCMPKSEKEQGMHSLR